MYRAASDGWERIGEIIPPLPTTMADDSAAGAGAAADQCGQIENCLVASSTPTKWVLVGHSMGVGAIESVIILFAAVAAMFLLFGASRTTRSYAFP